MPVGGKRPGAGRKPGKVSKAKRELAEMAKGYAEAALKTLADIAKNGTNESARVSASIAILDRAYGKPSQAVQHSGTVGSYDLTKVSDADLKRLESILRAATDSGGGTSGDQAAE